ncbi:hypothetical protein [Streptomyces yangpuensis]|uniref:hypothetical protein n=1 Tax=Streptomyces yangpuensis TaxID=1648182 RepID=UPI0036522897
MFKLLITVDFCGLRTASPGAGDRGEEAVGHSSPFRPSDRHSLVGTGYVLRWMALGKDGQASG